MGAILAAARAAVESFYGLAIQQFAVVDVDGSGGPRRRRRGPYPSFMTLAQRLSVCPCGRAPTSPPPLLQGPIILQPHTSFISCLSSRPSLPFHPQPLLQVWRRRRRPFVRSFVRSFPIFPSKSTHPLLRRPSSSSSSRWKEDLSILQ